METWKYTEINENTQKCSYVFPRISEFFRCNRKSVIRKAPKTIPQCIAKPSTVCADTVHSLYKLTPQCI